MQIIVSPTARDLRRPASFLYGALLFPFAWIANNILGSMHLLKMRDVPMVEVLTSLSIIFGLGFILMALLRIERPVWLSLTAAGLYLYLLAHSVL